MKLHWPWTELEKPEVFIWNEYFIWEKETKEDYPIAWFFQMTIPDLYREIIKSRVDRAWYWLRCHTYTRYHMLDLRNDACNYRWGWQDRCELILYANFNILKDFVEKEKPAERVCWEYNDESRHVFREINELYTWWTSQRKREHDEWWANNWELNKWSEYDRICQKDDEMLQRLVKIRNYLWT